MKYKIVTDSSSNLHTINGVNFSVIPLKITINEKEYIDSKNINIDDLLRALKNYNDEDISVTTTTQQWLEAFEDADLIFGITFTSHLSNSFQTARDAKKIYEKQYPKRKVFIIDSLSAGPEMQLMITKLTELVKLNKSYTEIRNTMMDYKRRTRLFFSLSSLDHISNNGTVRLSDVKETINCRFLGKANYDGNLISTHMCQDQKNAFRNLIKEMKASGYQGGRLVISHTKDEKSALTLKQLLNENFGNIQIDVTNNGGLCSYFSKMGGIMVGFEV